MNDVSSRSHAIFTLVFTQVRGLGHGTGAEGRGRGPGQGAGAEGEGRGPGQGQRAGGEGQGRGLGLGQGALSCWVRELGHRGLGHRGTGSGDWDLSL